jgi:hypothetical protein
MRRILIAATLLAFAAPAFADDASDLAAAKTMITGAKLSPAADLNMWCGAAFTLFSSATKESDAEKSKAADANASILFGKASPLLTADGVKAKNMGAISTAYMTLAASQLIANAETPAHTQEECQAAATAK